MEINRFEKFAVHVLRPKNTESGEPEIKQIGDKLQDKNAFIIYKYLKDER